MAKYASSETTRMLLSAVKERVVEERVYQLQPLLSSQVYVWAYMVVRQSNAWSQTQALFPFPPILLSNLLFLSSCRSSKCYTGLNVEFFLGRQQRNSLFGRVSCSMNKYYKKEKINKSVCSQTVMRFIIWTLFWAEKLKKIQLFFLKQGLFPSSSPHPQKSNFLKRAVCWHASFLGVRGLADPLLADIYVCFFFQTYLQGTLK